MPPSRASPSWRRRRITPVDRSEELELLPPPVRNLAADLVEGKETGWAQMAAIRDKFVNEGFYDVTPETPPGHSYARISEMLGDPARIVGYEEQYAAAAAPSWRGSRRCRPGSSSATGFRPTGGTTAGPT